MLAEQTHRAGQQIAEIERVGSVQLALVIGGDFAEEVRIEAIVDGRCVVLERIGEFVLGAGHAGDDVALDVAPQAGLVQVTPGQDVL